MTLTEEEVPLVIEALEHYYAFTRAKQNPDERYRLLAERLQPKKPAVSVSQQKKRKKA